MEAPPEMVDEVESEFLWDPRQRQDSDNTPDNREYECGDEGEQPIAFRDGLLRHYQGPKLELQDKALSGTASQTQLLCDVVVDVAVEQILWSPSELSLRLSVSFLSWEALLPVLDLGIDTVAY